MKNISALISGLVFGIGLAASGMTDTAKVIGFLDIFGRWVPDLIFVMGGAVITTFIGFTLIFKNIQKPYFAHDFSIPTKTIIDRKLLIGAALFGIGWGLYGYCPGPAVAALVYLSPVTLFFVIALLVGMKIGDWVSLRIS